jgi:hypothetical protein
VGEIGTYTQNKKIALFEMVNRFHDIWDNFNNDRIYNQLYFAMAKLNANEV